MTTLAPQVSPPATNDGRARAQSSLSYTSNRSRRSSGSGPKLDLTENSDEKKRLHTKANPNVATNELQPAAVAQQDGTLDDLRSMAHKDRFGNLIADPDRSNPTRSRMERPLDTIRAFQDAAEGTSSNRRSTYSRPNSQMSFNTVMDSKRASYYGGPQTPAGRPRPQAAGGYYRNSGYGFRPDSFVEEGPGSSEQWSNRGGLSRNVSAPTYYGNGQGSPSHSHQQSYETMTSGSEENSKSTNPSSQNSSFDQLQQLRQKDEHGYDGQNGYNGNFSSVSPARQYGSGPYGPHNGVHGAHSANGMNGMNGMRQPMAPLPPQKENIPNNPRVPIKLDSAEGRSEFDSDFKRSASSANKRQSWFKRKFSR